MKCQNLPNENAPLTKAFKNICLRRALARLKVIWEKKKSFEDCTTVLWTLLAEISERFRERNSKLVEALSAFDTQNDSTFLDVQLVQRMLNLTNSEVVHSEFAVARQFLRKELSRSVSSGEKMTVKQILQRHHATLEAVPSVLAAIKCALTFGASTAMCEKLVFHSEKCVHGQSKEHATSAKGTFSATGI